MIKKLMLLFFLYKHKEINKADFNFPRDYIVFSQLKKEC